MNYQLVFDPDLGVRADRFAAAWNGDPACRQMATAQVQAGGSQTYDPSLAEILNLVVVPLAFGVAGNALYDLIKDILLKQGIRRRTQIIHQKQPDGGELLIVTIEVSEAADASEDAWRGPSATEPLS